MRNTLVILLVIFWLLLGFFYFKTSDCACQGKTATNTAQVAPVVNEKATIEDPLVTKTLNAPLVFGLNSEQAVFRNKWDARKSSILDSIEQGNRLKITGQYYKDEINNSGESSLGIARAKSIQNSLNLKDNQVQLTDELINSAIPNRDTIEAAKLRFLQNTSAIDETSEDNSVLIRFPTDSVKKLNSKEVEAYLSRLAGQLSKSGENLQVIGHTDSQGSEAYNYKLGMERATFVKAFLVQSGLSADQILVLSKGELVPKETNNTEAGRSMNRRVELKITK